MKRVVALSNAAERDLRRIQPDARKRIGEALTRLLKEPPEGDVRKLAGRDNEYRLRVGDYRVRFGYQYEMIKAPDESDERVLVIFVLRIQDRKDAYR